MESTSVKRTKVDKRKVSEIDIELETMMNKNLRIDPIIVKNFMDACKSNNVILLNKYLKEQNVSPYMTDDEGKTPLIVAVISRSRDAAFTLMKCKSSNFNHRDVHGKDALFYACSSRYYELIKMLLKIPNIKIDTVDGNSEFMADVKINNIFTKAADGSLKTMKFSKFNPRDIEDNPQRQFRKALIEIYGGCMITGTKAEDCDYIHICNPTDNNRFKPYNGLILSNIFYRKYYKKNLIKFNVDNIKVIDEFTIGVHLVTDHPEIMEFNGKEIKFNINSMEYFMNNKPKPVFKKTGGWKKKPSKIAASGK